MHFQISRNGQLYGPYSLDELRRYIASGHILPSDLLKDEAMPDWIPVAQFTAAGNPVSRSQAPPPYASTYPAPPINGGPINANTFPDPPNLPWILALLIGIVTGGTFFIIWDIVLAAWARRIEPASQAMLLYIAAAILIVLNAGSSFGMVFATMHHHGVHANPLGALLGLAAWIVRLIARFSLRSTLESHFNGPEPLGLRLSAVMTFFFGGLYFQYKLNRINEIKNAFRYNTGAL
jgi:hypothetical protein